jgi:energy-coupling factor transport system permease protein
VRSPYAYVPRPGPLQSASPGAAVTYLGALVVVAFLYSNPLVLIAAGAAAVLAGVLAGAGDAVRAALRMGLTLALLIVVVNALVVDRGETVLLRLGEWPLLGRVEVTAEALAAGAVIGLRAAVTMVAFSVYSACVDPDRVLRALRPFAGRSALTATLISRLVPVAAADAARLRDAGQLRGPAAAPLGRATMARRLLTGSLDRAVDVAATLELRGYSLAAPDAARGGVLGRSDRVTHRKVRSPHRPPCVLAPLGPALARWRFESRFDRRFYLTGALVLAAVIAGKLAGADAFGAYPTIEVGLGAPTIALSLLLLLSGLAPLRRKPRRAARLLSTPTASEPTSA